MIDDGIVIMVIGMLVVFAFLTIMVISMKFISGFILKYFPEKEELTPANIGRNGAEVAVAIAVAYTKI